MAPDGERFLMVKAVATDDTSMAPHFILVQNWFEELRQRVPTD